METFKKVAGLNVDFYSFWIVLCEALSSLFNLAFAKWKVSVSNVMES